MSDRLRYLNLQEKSAIQNGNASSNTVLRTGDSPLPFSPALIRFLLCSMVLFGHWRLPADQGIVLCIHSVDTKGAINLRLKHRGKKMKVLFLLVFFPSREISSGL